MAKAEENKQPKRDYSRFDNLDTAALQTILQADFDAPEHEQMDAETAFYIADLLAKRQGFKPREPQAALADFYKYYYPLLENGEDLYDFTGEPAAPKRRRPIRPLLQKCWRQFAGVVAALVLLMFAGSVTAYALGYNPLGLLAGLTETQSQTEEPVTQELNHKLAEYGLVELVPEWLPSGYVFDKIEQKSISNIEWLAARFYKETAGQTTEIYINYTAQEKDMDFLASLNEKNFGNTVCYSRNGVDYYILGSEERRTIAWQNREVYGTIIGRLSLDEATQIINSIYAD